MKRPGVIAIVFAAAFSLALIIGSAARSSANATPPRPIEIHGIVRDRLGQPVAGLKLSFTDWFGAISGSAVTDLQGRFDIRGMAPGHYYLRLRPLGYASRGEIHEVNLPPHAVLLNLTLTRNVSAIARATRTMPRRAAHAPAA